jgi:hypothetical protein
MECLQSAIFYCSNFVFLKVKVKVKFTLEQLCVFKGKSKGKVHPRTGYEGPEGEYRYSSTLSLASAQDKMGGQHHAPAALTPRKTRHPLCRRLGGPQSRSGRV